MQVIIDGATAVLKLQVLDEAGVAQPIPDWTIAAAWRVSANVTAVTPVVAAVDSYSWLVLADSTGLGGRTVTLRATAQDPVSGKVLKMDAEYLVKA